MVVRLPREANLLEGHALEKAEGANSPFMSDPGGVSWMIMEERNVI